MAISIIGLSGAVAEVPGTTYRALNVCPRGFDYGYGGIYQDWPFGSLAAGIAANSEIMQLRWSPPAVRTPVALGVYPIRFAVVTDVNLTAFHATNTGYAAGFGKIDLLFARAWTVDGTSGSTNTGSNRYINPGLYRTPTLGMGVRYADAAGTALGAGTKTLDTDPIGLLSVSVPTTAFVTFMRKWPTPLLSEGMPVVLAPNEGLVARVTVPATGTGRFFFNTRWLEVAAY